MLIGRDKKLISDYDFWKEKEKCEETGGRERGGGRRIANGKFNFEKTLSFFSESFNRLLHESPLVFSGKLIIALRLTLLYSISIFCNNIVPFNVYINVKIYYDININIIWNNMLYR